MKKFLILLFILFLIAAGGIGATYVTYYRPALQMRDAISDGPVMKGIVAVQLNGETEKFNFYKDSDDVYLKTQEILDYALDQIKEDDSSNLISNSISAAFDYIDQDSYLGMSLITGLVDVDSGSNPFLEGGDAMNMTFLPVWNSKKLVKDSAFTADLNDMKFLKGKASKGTSVYVGFPKDTSDKRVYFYYSGDGSKMEGIVEYANVELPKNILSKDSIPDFVWEAIEETKQ